MLVCLMMIEVLCLFASSFRSKDVLLLLQEDMRSRKERPFSDSDRQTLILTQHIIFIDSIDVVETRMQLSLRWSASLE